MPNAVPLGGTTWAAYVPPQWQKAIQDAAQGYGGAQAGQMQQVMLNMGLLESNWGRARPSELGIPNGGVFQFSDSIVNRMNQVWGYSPDRNDPVSASNALARWIRETGLGIGIGNHPSTPARDTINFEYGPGTWHGGVNGYNDFVNGLDTAGARDIGLKSTRYTVQAVQGAMQRDELSPQLQTGFERFHGSGAWPNWPVSAIGSDANIPLGNLSDAFKKTDAGQWFLDPNMLQQQPGVLSPAAGAIAQQQGYLPMDWGWDPTSYTWQNSPGASNWTLEQVPGIGNTPALQLWDPAGPGIQYGPPDPLHGQDVWPIIQGGNAQQFGMSADDLANMVGGWFGGVSRPGGGYTPSGEGYTGDPRGLFYTPSQLGYTGDIRGLFGPAYLPSMEGYTGDPRGLFGDKAWLPAPAWYSGDPRGLTFWQGEPGKSNLSQILGPSGELTTWDPAMLNTPGAIGPQLGSYLQEQGIIGPGNAFDPTSQLWSNTSPGGGDWSRVNTSNINPAYQTQIMQQLSSLYPGQRFDQLFGSGIYTGGTPDDPWSGTPVLNWLPPPPQGAEYQYAPYDEGAEGRGPGYQGSYGITKVDPGVVGLGNAIYQNAQQMIAQGYGQAAAFNQQQQFYNNNPTYWNPNYNLGVNPYAANATQQYMQASLNANSSWMMPGYLY